MFMRVLILCNLCCFLGLRSHVFIWNEINNLEIVHNAKTLGYLKTQYLIVFFNRIFLNIVYGIRVRTLHVRLI